MYENTKAVIFNMKIVSKVNAAILQVMAVYRRRLLSFNLDGEAPLQMQASAHFPPQQSLKI